MSVICFSVEELAQVIFTFADRNEKQALAMIGPMVKYAAYNNAAYQARYDASTLAGEDLSDITAKELTAAYYAACKAGNRDFERAQFFATMAQYNTHECGRPLPSCVLEMLLDMNSDIIRRQERQLVDQKFYLDQSFEKMRGLEKKYHELVSQIKTKIKRKTANSKKVLN